MALRSMLPAAMLALVGFGVGIRPARGEDVPGPVPVPSATAMVEVSAGNSYPFPWSGVATCQRPFQPGCFVVKEIGPGQAVLAYTRVELQGTALKPQGFRYVTPVTAAGSGYELFTVKHGGGREEWVYAVLEGVERRRALVRFLKLPAFVTDRARLAASIAVDQGRRRLEERYLVEADEPLTLIGLGRVDRVYPSGRLEAVEINGRPVQLPYTDIVHLNLPPGRHEVRVAVSFGARADELTIQGTLLEPRKMSLIHSLELRVEPEPGLAAPELEVRTVGLPPEVWELFKGTLVIAPAPVGQAADPLAVRYRFGTSDAITLTASPRIPVGPNNYPVMIRVRAAGP